MMQSHTHTNALALIVSQNYRNKRNYSFHLNSHDYKKHYGL